MDGGINNKRHAYTIVEMKGEGCMQPDYVKIVTSSKKRSDKSCVVLPIWIRKCFDLNPRRIEQQIEEYGYIRGIRIQLPIDEKVMSQLTEDFMQQYIQYIQNSIDLTGAALILEPSIEQQLGWKKERFAPYFVLLWIREMIDQKIEKKALDRKNLRILIYDDGD